MAKDDYDAIVYRVLVYLYACLKRKILFEEETFQEAVRKNVESDGYFFDVLRMMQEEGLIKDLCFKKTWGGDMILISDISDARITPTGIHYLEDNDIMKKVGNILKGAADTIAKLAAIIGLISKPIRIMNR